MRRQTKQREAILNFLRQTDSHPTADRIYDEVRKTMPKISKGTVYRNLQVLQEEGHISEVKLYDTAGRYEIKKKAHYHFRCCQCGQVNDIDIPVMEELDRQATKETGLAISGHQLEFRGLCKECENNSIKEEGHGS
jgi:Fe2+ or Zn2+ uptake regulation protein